MSELRAATSPAIGTPGTCPFGARTRVPRVRHPWNSPALTQAS